MAHLASHRVSSCSWLGPSSTIHGIIPANVDLQNDVPVEHYLPPESAEQGPFLALRMWLAGSPWRLTGGWLVLAGLVASAGLRVREQPLLDLVLALVLVEALWGGLWLQIVLPAQLPGALVGRRPRLPYANPTGPAGRLLGWRQGDDLPGLVRGVVPLLAAALLVAWLVGTVALALTAVAVVLATLAGLSRRAGLPTWVQWLHALVLATLPFVLGISLAGPWPVGPVGWRLIALATSYTLLAGVSLAVTNQGAAAATGLPLLLQAGLGAGIVIGVLLLSGQVVAAGLEALLVTAPLLILARPAMARPRTLNGWWLLLVLTSSLAIGLGIG